MSFKLRIHPEAAKEFYDSILWYDEQQPGLGQEFEAEVFRTLQQIEVAPQSGGVISTDFRQRAVDGFPFVVVYKIAPTSDVIYVSAIFHTSRHPAGKYRE